MKLGDLVYLVLGIFDALAVLVIALKLYRMPLLQHKWNVLGIAVCIAVVSYLNRIVLGIPQYDLLIQTIIFILGLRFLIKYLYFWSTLMIVTAIVIYIPLQYLIYYLLIITGVTNFAAATEIEGLGAYIIQRSTIVVVYLLAWLFYRQNLGFSLFTFPPHYFQTKSNVLAGPNRKLIIGIVLGVLFIYMDMILLLHLTYLWIFPFALIVSIIVSGAIYYLSHRRNLE